MYSISADHRAGSGDGRGRPYYTIISLGRAIFVETLAQVSDIAVPLCLLRWNKDIDGPYLPIKKSLRESYSLGQVSWVVYTQDRLIVTL